MGCCQDCGLEIAHCFHLTAAYRKQVAEGTLTPDHKIQYYLEAATRGGHRLEPGDSALRHSFQALNWLSSQVREVFKI